MKKKKKIESILVFDNLNIAAFCDNQQVPEIQKKTLLHLVAEYAESVGYDLEGARFAFRERNTYIRKTESGDWILE